MLDSFAALPALPAHANMCHAPQGILLHQCTVSAREKPSLYAGPTRALHARSSLFGQAVASPLFHTAHPSTPCYHRNPSHRLAHACPWAGVRLQTPAVAGQGAQAKMMAIATTAAAAAREQQDWTARDTALLPAGHRGHAPVCATPGGNRLRVRIRLRPTAPCAACSRRARGVGGQTPVTPGRCRRRTWTGGGLTPTRGSASGTAPAKEASAPPWIRSPPLCWGWWRGAP